MERRLIGFCMIRFTVNRVTNVSINGYSHAVKVAKGHRLDAIRATLLCQITQKRRRFVAQHQGVFGMMGFSCSIGYIHFGQERIMLRCLVALFGHYHGDIDDKFATVIGCQGINVYRNVLCSVPHFEVSPEHWRACNRVFHLRSYNRNTSKTLHMSCQPHRIALLIFR